MNRNIAGRMNRIRKSVVESTAFLTFRCYVHPVSIQSLRKFRIFDKIIHLVFISRKSE